MSTIDFLKENVKSGMSLDALIGLFEEMCQLPDVHTGTISLDTGAFSAMGEKRYSFTLMQKSETGGTVCMEVLFPVTEENKRISSHISEEDVEGDFFRCIRSSRAYQTLESIQPDKVEVYFDED